MNHHLGRDDRNLRLLEHRITASFSMHPDSSNVTVDSGIIWPIPCQSIDSFSMHVLFEG